MDAKSVPGEAFQKARTLKGGLFVLSVSLEGASARSLDAVLGLVTFTPEAVDAADVVGIVLDGVPGALLESVVGLEEVQNGRSGALGIGCLKS